jgi:dihydroorotase
VGVKTYLGSSTGDLLLEDMNRFQAVLEAAGKAGRPVALHAEAERILQGLRRTENTIHDHDHTRPPQAEVEAVYDAMKAQAAVRKPPKIHIAHAASPDVVHAATAGKFSLGVCPHHLLLDTDVGLGHAYGKMNPPLRSPQVREELWKMFAAGKIPILESDHAPHTKADKEATFHAAPSGVPGVETMVPLMLAMVKAGKVGLDTVVDAACKNPAELIGATTRGVLEAGARADFAVYDLKHATKVDSGELHSKCGWSPFDGLNAIFPSDVFLAGKPIVQQRQFVGKAGQGQPIVQPKR